MKNIDRFSIDLKSGHENHCKNFLSVMLKVHNLMGYKMSVKSTSFLASLAEDFFYL